MPVNDDGLEIEVVTGRRAGSRASAPGRPGGDNPNASLTDDKARQLREYRAAGWSHSDLAAWFKISVARSSEICKGHAYPAAGGPIEAAGRVYNRSVLSGEVGREKAVASVLELRGKGLSQREIAARIGKSKSFVGAVLSEQARKEAA